MSRLLHVCLYNANPSASNELVAQISRLNFVRLAGEVGTPEDLASLLLERDINLTFFHLDPKPELVIEVVDQVSTRYPGMALIALSERTKPAEILAPMRAGCDQFVCMPIDPGDLAQAVARVANKRLLSRTHGRCICITSAAGGDGATSIACNLALEIARVAETTCALIDMDTQLGAVDLLFDIEPKYTTYDLAVSGEDLDHTVVDGVVTKLPCNVALLARPRNIEQAEMITPEAVQRILELLVANYENVVVDLPRTIDGRTLVAYRHADLILIVCQLVVPSVRNAKRLKDALVHLGVHEDRIETVVNRTGSGTKRVSLEDVQEMIGKPVYASIPNDYEFVTRSLDLGRPVAALDRKNVVRTAIRNIARRIVEDPTTETHLKEAKRGLFGRLFDSV